MVVFPTPFTPTTIITWGLVSFGIVNSESFPELVSDKSEPISSLKIKLSSSVPRYLSWETLFSMRWIIFNVVFTPTSEEISTSSKLSKTSSSTLDFPATALVKLEKKDVFVFSNPLIFYKTWNEQFS